jgi:hypothetical protein
VIYNNEALYLHCFRDFMSVSLHRFVKKLILPSYPRAPAVKCYNPLLINACIFSTFYCYFLSSSWLGGAAFLHWSNFKWINYNDSCNKIKIMFKTPASASPIGLSTPDPFLSQYSPPSQFASTISPGISITDIPILVLFFEILFSNCDSIFVTSYYHSIQN